MNHRYGAPRASITCAIDGCEMPSESSATPGEARCWRHHLQNYSSYILPSSASPSGSTSGGLKAKRSKPAFSVSSTTTGANRHNGAFPTSRVLSQSHHEPRRPPVGLPDPPPHLLGLGPSFIAPNRASPVEPKIGPAVSLQGASPSITSHGNPTPPASSLPFALQHGYSMPSYSLPPLMHPLAREPASAANRIHRPQASMPSQRPAGSTNRHHAPRPGAISPASNRAKLREVIDLTGGSEDEGRMPKQHTSVPDRSMNSPHPNGAPKNHSSLASPSTSNGQVEDKGVRRPGKEPSVRAGAKLVKTPGEVSTAGQQNSNQDSIRVSVDSPVDLGPSAREGQAIGVDVEELEWVSRISIHVGSLVNNRPHTSSAASQVNLSRPLPSSEMDRSKEPGVSAQAAANASLATKKFFTPKPSQPVPKVNGHLQSIASQVTPSHDSSQKAAAAQESSPQAIDGASETNSKPEELSVRQSATFTTPKRKRARRTVSSERVYIRANPLIHGMHPHPDELQAQGVDAIGTRTRGKSKQWFGNVTGRRRWLRAQARYAEEREKLAGATEPIFHRADPEPWGHKQILDFGDIPEEKLPDDVKNDPAWLQACEWLRSNKAKKAEMDKAYKADPTRENNSRRAQLNVINTHKANQMSTDYDESLQQHDDGHRSLSREEAKSLAEQEAEQEALSHFKNMIR